MLKTILASPGTRFFIAFLSLLSIFTVNTNIAFAAGPEDECVGGPGSAGFHGGFMSPPPHFGGGFPMGPAGAPPPPGMMLPLMGIDLQDEQIEKLAQLKSTFMDKSGPVVVKLRSLEHQFRSSLGDSQLNQVDLKKLSDQISAQKQTLDSLMSDNVIAMAQVLTPEQRHQIKLHMEKAELGRFEPPKLKLKTTEK